MVVGKITQYLSPAQCRRLEIVQALVKDFHKENDNPVTYNLEGLLRHLLNLGRAPYASEYVQQKIEIIEGSIK